MKELKRALELGIAIEIFEVDTDNLEDDFEDPAEKYSVRFSFGGFALPAYALTDITAEDIDGCAADVMKSKSFAEVMEAHRQ